ncbi:MULTISPECIES: hypothetical protein [unclassified Paenibacillus]|uniref:hypothetical protein n=1 Tax=unclassified Paenibacillus TaxID=185978 RepID=UPI0027816350|nr:MULTISPECIES: hypothetical protein [unclassified Paenibacillus]MDQ0896393.1 hypothetical protein [Paenibacillus sp. V4I7]MDQ0914063.1 hypothetical protein [Paenibacillus sp. V4I5]
MRKLQDLLDVVKERGISENAEYIESSGERTRFSVIGHLLVLLGMDSSELMQLSGSLSRMLTNPQNKYEVKAVWLLLEAGYSMLDLRQLERSGKNGADKVMADLYELIDDIMDINLVTMSEYGLLVRKLVKYRRMGVPASMMTFFYVGKYPVKTILDSTGRSEEDLRNDVDFVLTCGILEDPEDQLVCEGSFG